MTRQAASALAADTRAVPYAKPVGGSVKREAGGGRRRNGRFHVHLESSTKRNPLFHLTKDKWVAATRRHRELARNIDVTIGWDRDIIDEALETADVMINSNPPRERLAERAPRLRWIQTTGAGVDTLLPLDWLPPRVTLTNNTGAHGAKAEDSCAMALLMLNARLPAMLANQRARQWEPAG